MRPLHILVTGASGFLGRYVVKELLRRGHRVRALVRSSLSPNASHPNLEILSADLNASSNISAAFSNIGVVIHLAAQMSGSSADQLRNTVDCTRNLLAAMANSSAKHLVLASSLSVYDWSTSSSILSESTALEPRPETRDAYTNAKIQQEKIAEEFAANHCTTLAILRPGYIWGAGASVVPGVTASVGPFKVIMAPSTVLPLVYVENCASGFALAAEKPSNIIANLVDPEMVCAWRFVRENCLNGGQYSLQIPIPYGLGSIVAQIANVVASPLGLSFKLPGLLQPRRFRARFRPLRVDTVIARNELQWAPQFTYSEATNRARNIVPTDLNPVDC